MKKNSLISYLTPIVLLDSYNETKSEAETIPSKSEEDAFDIEPCADEIDDDEEFFTEELDLEEWEGEPSAAHHPSAMFRP